MHEDTYIEILLQRHYLVSDHRVRASSRWVRVAFVVPYLAYDIR
jgi:hypothetical protein